MDFKSTINKLPNTPGIYIFKDKNNNIIYIGKSQAIRKRVRSYFLDGTLGAKTKSLVKRLANISYIQVNSDFEAILLESELIKKYKPFFNIQAKDNKKPLYIKITNDKIPLVLLSRLDKEQGIFLKGPFQSSKTARQILKVSRKTFPFCHHKNPPKPCLYTHLNLCPYPYLSKKTQVEYIKSINKLKKLLSGNHKKLIKNLILEMKVLSHKQKFEQAEIVKKQIAKIQEILTINFNKSELLNRPGLAEDVALTRLADLKRVLILKKIPKRIECFDVSDLQGKNATGSMAVFINGVSEKSQYRKFKIRFAKKPNDYQMLKEVLLRRFHNNWDIPDIVVIDGGKGHLNTALTALKKFNLQIIVISIAKRYEQIYIQNIHKPLTLSKESPARQLIQAARDEAHRFALAYHKILRAKSTFKGI